MIRRTIYLDKYDWLADIYFDYKCKYSDDLIDKLESMGISEERLDIAYADLNSCKDNIGLTYSSFIEKKTIIVIGEATSAKECDFEKLRFQLTNEIMELQSLKSEGAK